MARGDHLFVYCLGYSHHGIDCGNDRVIHFNSDPLRKLGNSAANPARVIEVNRQEFAKGREIQVRRYELSDDPDIVITRARQKLGDAGYELFHNNCEHFAMWCKTGSAASTQVEDVKDAVKPLGKGLPAAAVLVRSARYLPGHVRPAAYGAALALTAGAFATRYFENRLRRIVRGES